MPTRLRIDLAGYHHIMNRGVNKTNIFNNDIDKDSFMQILNKNAVIHKVILHDYVLTYTPAVQSPLLIIIETADLDNPR